MAQSRPRRHRREGLRQFDREGKHDRGAALARDVEQRAEIAKLHRLRYAREDAGCLDKLLGRLLFPLGMDDLGAAFALGLGLAGDGADHAVVKIDALQFDSGYLDAPPLGLLVEDVLDVGVELVALGQHLVEVVLSRKSSAKWSGRAG